MAAQANELSAFEKQYGDQHLDEAAELLPQLNPNEFPHLARLSQAAMEPAPIERVRWAIRTFINGISVRDASKVSAAPGEATDVS